MRDSTMHPDHHEASTSPRGQAGHRRRRQKLPAALGLGLAGALALSACAGSPEASATDSATVDGSATVTESATASEASAPSETATSTATSEPESEESNESEESEPAGGTDMDGPTQTHSTEGDHFQWTLPASWTVTEELAGPDTSDEYGVENERWVFQNHDEKALFTADTGQGPMDGDGVKPDVVEVLETEELEDIPVDPSNDGDVHYRAAILEDNGQGGEQGFFEGEDYRLAVQVTTVPEGTDPESTEEFWDAWTYVLPPAEGTEQGTAATLQGHITQADAEELTGEEGEDALRAVVETGQYQELRLVATSMEVTAP